MTDQLGRIIVANSSADQAFDPKDGIWLTRGRRLAGSDPDLLEEITAAIEEVSRTSSGEGVITEREFSIDRRGSDNPLLLLVTPLRDTEMELDKGLHGALLTIIDTDQTSDLRLDAFGEAYGLTPTERSVAALMVSGLPSPALGEELGVSLSTVRTHVKSVLSKTKAKNRANFVWRALQFSPPVE